MHAYVFMFMYDWQNIQITNLLKKPHAPCKYGRFETKENETNKDSVCTDRVINSLRFEKKLSLTVCEMRKYEEKENFNSDSNKMRCVVVVVVVRNSVLFLY